MRILHALERAYRIFIPKLDAIGKPVRTEIVANSLRRTLNDPVASNARVGIASIVESLSDDRLVESVVSRLEKIDDYKNKLLNYSKRETPPKESLKIAIFTAIVGDYDTLKIPAFIDSSFDYFVFTDQEIKSKGVFNVLPLPFFHNSPTKMARYVKTHPHILLDGYDVAVWVDASILISGDIRQDILKFHSKDVELGVMPHPLRNSVFEEIEACILHKKGNLSDLENQRDNYLKHQMEDAPLIESGFIFFNLNSVKTKEVLDKWWFEIIKYSDRDQVSFGFVAQQLRLELHWIVDAPYGIRSSNKLILCSHNSAVAELFTILNSRLPDAQTPQAAISEQQKRLNFTGCTVVLCVHNAPSETKTCIESIIEHKDSSIESLIVIDDGSDKETEDIISNFSKLHTWIKCYKNENASGYTRAANKGMRHSKSNITILLNSDTVVTSGWSRKITEAYTYNMGAGIIGVMSNAAGAQSLPNITSKNGQTAINPLPPKKSLYDVNKFCETYHDTQPYLQVPLVHGFCFAISKDVIDAIGYFDEVSFPRGYGEENDYCLRATEAGFLSIICLNVFVYHEKSKSFGDDERILNMKRGAKKLTELYGDTLINECVLSIQKNPVLEDYRNKAIKFWKS